MNKPNGGTTQDAFPISPTPIDSLSLHRRTISHGESRTPEYEAWPSDTQDLLDDGLLPRKSEGDHSGTALASAAKLGVQLSSYEKREQIIASDDHERLLFDASSDPDGFAAYQQRDGGTAMHDHHHHNTKDEAHHVRAHSSAVSLGLASEDNGFTSKESFGQRYDSSSSIDTRRSSVLSSNSNDNNKEAAASTVSLASDPSKKSSSGQKRKSRKERERERTRQFAKEMAFVVSDCGVVAETVCLLISSVGLRELMALPYALPRPSLRSCCPCLAASWRARYSRNLRRVPAPERHVLASAMPTKPTERRADRCLTDLASLPTRRRALHPRPHPPQSQGQPRNESRSPLLDLGKHWRARSPPDSSLSRPRQHGPASGPGSPRITPSRRRRLPSRSRISDGLDGELPRCSSRARHLGLRDLSRRLPGVPSRALREYDSCICQFGSRRSVHVLSRSRQPLLAHKSR